VTTWVEQNIPSIGQLRPAAPGRKKWGNWTYLPSTRQLRYANRYHIELLECTTSAALLDRIFQVSKKVWLTTQDRSDMIEALDYLLDPQGTVCGMGFDRKCDRKDFFRNRGER
jgi:hypothetical protein